MHKFIAALKHIRLEQRSLYETVSYTWGDQCTQRPITVDAVGSTVDVGYNCLFMLRSLQRATKLRFLWVDTLCINQTDMEEKT
jgi:hypothetical protein